MKNEVHPVAEQIVRECLGRLRGRLMYSETEAADAVRAVLAKPVSRKNHGYIPSAECAGKPWTPGQPKPRSEGA